MVAESTSTVAGAVVWLICHRTPDGGMEVLRPAFTTWEGCAGEIGRRVEAGAEVNDYWMQSVEVQSERV